MEELLATILDSLTLSVRAVMNYAKRCGITELPEVIHTLRYWRRGSLDEQDSGPLVNETFGKPSFSEFFHANKPFFDANEDIRSLKGNCDAFVEKFGIVEPVGAGLYIWPQRLLQVYFDQVQQFRFKGSVAKRVVKQFGEDLSSDTFTILDIFHLEQFDAPHKIALGDKRNITLRPVTLDDIFEYGGIPQKFEFFQRDPMYEYGWICQIETPGRKDNYWQDWNETRNTIGDVLNALMLTQSGYIKYRLLRRCPARPFSVGPTLLGKRASVRLGVGAPLTLDRADIHRLRTLFRKLCRVADEDHFEHLRLPLRRLNSFGLRKNDEDRITDVVIALERLLAYDLKTEIGYRFRLRGASLLPESFGGTRDRLDLMQDLYNLRSDIVHGNTGTEKLKTATEKMNLEQRIRHMLPKAEGVLRAVFRWYLDHLDYWIPEKGVSKNTAKRKLVQTLDAWMVEGAFRKAH